MLGKGGSKARTYAEVLDALYPLAAQIHVYGDKESVVFEGTVHRDNLAKFADLLAEQILTPRFADDDFARNRHDALDYVTKTLRGNADEDLGKQAMATAHVSTAHPYGQPSQGTVAGLNAVTLEDVKQALRGRTSRAIASSSAWRAAIPTASPSRSPSASPPCPPRRRRRASCRRRRCRASNQVIVVEKDARANAISIGRPTRSPAPTPTSIR